MKSKILLFIFLTTSVAIFAQVRPDQFTEETSPTNANFEVYSQKNGQVRRASLLNLKKYFTPEVETTAINYVPTATGNTTNLMEFVKTAGDSIYYIDAVGSAFLLRDPAASGGSTELADGSTIIGNGTVGNEFKVDTSLIATQHDIAGLGSGGAGLADGITILGDGSVGSNYSVDTGLVATQHYVDSLRSDSILTLVNYQSLLDFNPSTYQHDFINIDSFQYTDGNGITKTVPRSSWVWTNTSYSDSVLMINGWQRLYEGNSIQVDWVGWGTDNEQSQKAIDLGVDYNLDVDWSDRTYIIDGRLNIREVNNMELRGNGARLKYPSGSTLNTTLSVAYTASSTTLTVANVPSGWKVGDFIRMTTDGTNSNTSNASKITNISGNTITISPDIRSQFGGSFGNQSIGTNVCKTLNIFYGKPSFTEAQYGTEGVNEKVRIKDFIFDGNKADGNEVILSWVHNTIFQGQGRDFVLEGNTFVDCPNEVISGHGLRIVGNTFINSGGSPYHQSSHDNTFDQIYPSYFINNKVINCNLVDQSTNGHNEGQITYSWNGGYLIVSNNWFVGNGSNNSILGALTTYLSPNNNREQVIFANNYCRNFESVFYSIHESETYGYTVVGNTFDSCGTIDLSTFRRNKQNLWEANLILGNTLLTGEHRDVWVDSLIRFTNILPIDGSKSDSATLWQGQNGKLYYTDGLGATERISPVPNSFNEGEIPYGQTGGGDLTQTPRLVYSTAFGLELQGTGNTNTTRAFSNINDDDNNIFSTFSGGKIQIASAMDIYPIDASGNDDITTNAKGIKLVSKGSVFQTVSEGLFVIDRTSTQNFGGTSTNIRFRDNFNPSTGAHNKHHVVINQVVNQTGSASGNLIDLLINPTFTSILGNYTALEIRNGANTGFNITGTGNNSLMGKLGVGKATPTTSLDIIGTNLQQLSIADNSTDATTKTASIITPHYTNSEEPFAWVRTQTGSVFNTIRFGGGDGSANAATAIDFYTAANNTTLIGTKRMSINTDGDVAIGNQTPTMRFHVDGDVRFEDYGLGNMSATNLSVTTNNQILGTSVDGELVDVDFATCMDVVVSTRSYADNTAATGAGLTTGQVYYNTTSSTFVVLP